jgi:hypothetical protein
MFEVLGKEKRVHGELFITRSYILMDKNIDIYKVFELLI